jgi:hypothetical protein
VVELKVPSNLTPGSYTLVVATGGITGSLGSVPISGPAGTLTIVDANRLVFTFTNFDRWRADKGVTGNPNDIDPRNGRTHFFNYAFGLDAAGGNAPAPIIDTSVPGNPKLRYTRRKPPHTDVQYFHEYSTNLKDWSPFTPVTLVTNGGDPVESVTVELPRDQRSLNPIFIRVRASAP